MIDRIAIAVLALLACGGGSDEATRDTASEPEVVVDEDIAPEADADTEPSPPDPIDLAEVPPEGVVVAGVAEKAADLVGGPKAEGQLGDLVLANHRARFLIEAARPAGGYRQFGGNLVDADLQPGGEDRFSELWLVWNLRAFRADSVEVVSDGRDGLAVVRASGRITRYAWVDAVLGDLLIADPIDFATVYEYRLAPDSNVLELAVTFDNDRDETARVRLPAVAMNMGDGAPAFTPGPGLASIAGGTPWTWTGGVGLERAYALIPPPGSSPVALFQETNVQISQLTAFDLAPGETRTLTFQYVVADDGATTIAEVYADLHDTEVAVLTGAVRGDSGWADDDGEARPSNTFGRSWVALTRGSDVLALTPVRDDGSWRAAIPPGEVTIQAFAPGRGGSEPVHLEDAAAAPPIELELPDLGRVVVRVRDPAGDVVPAQVTIIRLDAPSPFAPEPVRYGDDWGRGRSVVAYQTGSQIVAQLLPGQYQVVASRGYSWEVAAVDASVAPGTMQTIELTIEKTVDDSGWVAADLHLHAFWSPDSEVPYPARLRQAAANDVSLPVFTEHTYIGPLEEPVLEAAVSEWVTPVSGHEVSTVEYGHFGVFPWAYDPTLPSGGALFEHGWEGAELFEAMREHRHHEVVVQVNHPRSSTNIKAYFGSIGLDSTTLEASVRPDRWTLDWDSIEVFNAGCRDRGGNHRTLEDWFNFNDLGIIKTLGSGSDSHSEAEGIGHPRSWIAVSRSDVAADPGAIVAPLRARRTFVSCGPFVRFSAADGTPMGGRTRVDEAGGVRFEVRVEAPSWMIIDRVRLLENGRPVEDVDVGAWSRPDGLAPAVRFDGTIAATPAADAWYVIEVVGSGGLWPLDSEDPYALTNPIEVDDGDGVWIPPAETNTTRNPR